MDYEEKYKEALERAREQYNKRTPLYDIESIFPELAESEDEKIRKTLIEYIKGIKSWNYFLGISKEQMLAWLEKQGENKHTDKVEPKFKVGDWISVEDEFPIDYEPVLAAFANHFARVCFHCGETWYLNKPLAAEEMEGITHWMPLPAPPSCSEFPNNHIIDVNKKVDRVIGTADHIKTALDVLNKKGGEE